MSPSQRAALSARLSTSIVEMLEARSIIYMQKEEAQSEAHPVITCFCKNRKPMREMHKCLYCESYFCTPCAERHFGQSKAEYERSASVMTVIEELLSE